MNTVNKIVTNPKSEKTLKAKETLSNFVSLIEKELEEYFDSEISSSFGVSKTQKELSQTIWQHIKEHNLHPAKRLRGSFIYYAYKLLGGTNLKAALEAAMSIELIHTALLMHDDFMDEDSTRRGNPTTHIYFKSLHNRYKYKGSDQHYGDSMAVLAGDIALLSGYDILSRSSFPDPLKVVGIERVLRGIINTGLGQAFDVTLEAKRSAHEKEIIDLHYAKTGIYTYENPLHVGAILAAAHEEDLLILSEYAIPGGIAFQLQDDILGLFGDPDKTGKPAHSDLRQGKMTLLIIKAFEFGTPSQVKKLKSIWGKRDLTSKEAEEARKIVSESGSLDYSIKTSLHYAKEAQKVIDKMQKKNWDKEAIAYLDGIAQYMIERDI